MEKNIIFILRFHSSETFHYRFKFDLFSYIVIFFKFRFIQDNKLFLW